MQIVVEAVDKAHMRVSYEGECNGSVQDTTSTMLYSTDGEKRDQSHRDETLKCPMVRSVCGMRLGECCRVIDSALDVSCTGARRGD